MPASSLALSALVKALVVYATLFSNATIMNATVCILALKEVLATPLERNLVRL
jgi:hypothetical protein